ncbi:hypothetical protein [Kitasatospora terrestris]|uniref:Uncharacterized protein n=1 Tax=Kitasatospora terrestris TaxID=258051 RepID=A0ABP9EK79_9ACTN
MAEGGRALVLVGGVFGHASRKDALLTEPGVIDNDRVPHLGVAPYRPTGAEVRTASAAPAAVPSRGVPLFARVDPVLDDLGGPTVLELELVEPNLFLVPGDRRGGSGTLRRRGGDAGPKAAPTRGAGVAAGGGVRAHDRGAAREGRPSVRIVEVLPGY